MPRPTTASSPKAIVVRRESDRLVRHLRIRQPFETALATGRITRSKVAEAWLYHPASISIEEVIEAAQLTTDQLLTERLATPLSILAGMVSARIEPSCSKAAARALLHHLVSSGQLERLGLLTANNEPHLAIYRSADADEIARQLQHLRTTLAADGQFSHAELPEPLRSRAGQAWADTLISHAEFAGWGRITGGTLQAWPTP